MKQVFEWVVQRITGVVLLFGLVLHFYTIHYSGSDQIRHEVILSRLNNPAWIGFNIIFLIAVVYHGINGIMGIIREYVHSHAMQKVLESLLVVIAFVLVGVGVYILRIR